MNFNIEDLIKRIEQLEANTVNTASVYELTKTIDKISTRLDSVESVAKKAASSSVFAPIISEIKKDIVSTKESIAGLFSTQKADKKELSDYVSSVSKSIKPPVEAKSYDNEILALNNSIGAVKNSIASIGKPINYDSKIAEINSAISKTKEELSNSVSELAKTIKPPITPKVYDNEIASLKEAVFGVKESIKSQAKEVLSLDSKLKETIKPIEKIEQVVDSARRTYGEELSSFTLKTNKKLDAINEIIGVNNGE